MTTIIAPTTSQIDPKEYKRRIWAWTMYDWANSAFATTILAAVLPVYFSQVAGSTLPSATVATSYWSFGLFLSLLIVALISPVLGTVSDIMRGKKRFLAIFAGLGIISTAMLVLVSTGDWVLASILAIIGRIGFSGANTFYDALLPHVAREEDRDVVSARGYAMGYLGGGLLLAVNIVMIQLLPGDWGARLSFLSVAIWWAVFSIPLFRHVPEPPAEAVAKSSFGEAVSDSFVRLRQTIRDISHYRELFKFLVAFLIYNDGIGTIIGVAAIYGAELGFGATELILALLLVQFVGIPYSLVFGKLPSPSEKRRPVFLAFVLLNMMLLPITGIVAARLLPAEVSGAKPTPFASTASAVGEGLYLSKSAEIRYQGEWQPFAQEDIPESEALVASLNPSAGYAITYNGQNIRLIYSQGPDHGIWSVLLDGQPVIDEETGGPLTIDAYNRTLRVDASQTFQADAPGEHILELVNTNMSNPSSQGKRISLISLEVLQPVRESNLGVIIGIIFGLELLMLLVSFLLGPLLLSGLALRLNVKSSILLALIIYSIVAVWGFFLDSVIEFWFLAWMVAVVQGGSQALSRSLYAALSPAAKSGEFFGLFGIMEKFSSIIGPILFAAAGIIFGSSRPAVLSLVVLFFLGGYLLTRVDIEEGKRTAQLEDAQIMKGDSAA